MAVSSHCPICISTIGYSPQLQPLNRVFIQERFQCVRVSGPPLWSDHQRPLLFSMSSPGFVRGFFFWPKQPPCGVVPLRLCLHSPTDKLRDRLSGLLSGLLGRRQRFRGKDSLAASMPFCGLLSGLVNLRSAPQCFQFRPGKKS